MRFRFCGDLDCPDWVLLEISIVSKLSSAKIAIISNQILNACLNGSFDEEALMKITKQNEDDISDIKGVVATIHFMISNAAKYDVDELSLSQEIQQLGLPKDNADVISNLFRDNKDALRDRFAADSYRISKVMSSSWRIDQVLANSEDTEPGCSAHIKLVVDPRPQDDPNRLSRLENIAFEISEDKLDVLVHELIQAQKLLEGVNK